MEELREKGRNREEDELLRHLADTNKTLSNPQWDLFVDTEQFEKLKSGAGKRLSVHSVLKPSVLEGFGSVFVAAANFQDTAQYHVWSDKGVRFKEDREFTSGLRFGAHLNGHLIDIVYTAEAPWSKKRRNAISGPEGEHNTHLLLIAKAAQGLFGNARFIWQANTDVPDDLFGTNAERLPNKPHGLNSFSDVNNIAFLSALNPASEHFKFLETLGLSGEDVRTAIYHAAAYQSVMRTSIRDVANPDRKIIIVPDLALAEYLRDRFPGSRVQKLDVGIVEEPRKSGRPRQHQSNKARVAEQRAKAKAEKLRIWNEQIVLNLRQDHSKDWLQDGCAEKGITSITPFGTPVCSGTLYPAKNSPVVIGYVQDQGDPEFFVAFLRAFYRRPRNSKDRYVVISPSVFDPNKSEVGNRTSRKHRLHPAPVARF